MELDFTKQTEVLHKFNQDAYRYLNDRRISSFAGERSDPFYVDLIKLLNNNGKGDFGPFINLGLTRSIYIYNSFQAKFFRLTLNDEFLRYICESFYVKTTSTGMNGSIRFNRTDSRKIDLGDPYYIYANVRNSFTDKHSEKDIPTYVNLYSKDKFLDTLHTFFENFFKYADTAMLINKDELVANQSEFIDEIRRLSIDYDPSFVTGLEKIPAYDYYFTRKADPFNPIDYKLQTALSDD